MSNSEPLRRDQIRINGLIVRRSGFCGAGMPRRLLWRRGLVRGVPAGMADEMEMADLFHFAEASAENKFNASL